MMKLLDKLLLLLLIVIINYPSASLATRQRACGVSNHCIGFEECGWTFYGYRKSCCVDQNCSCKASIWDSVYCPDFVINTALDFRNLCRCFPDSCYYKDDTNKMIMKCLNFIALHASQRDFFTCNDREWWNRMIMFPPIHN